MVAFFILYSFMVFRKNLHGVFIRDFKKALFIAWVIISLVILFIQIAPFILLEEFLLSVTPACKLNNIGQGCFLCGMTKGFINISKGYLYRAYRVNNFSVYLYLIFWLNIISLFIFSVIIFYRRKL
ncbi:hypothetical protein ACFLSV_04340 [Bacteroidota bacterium]